MSRSALPLCLPALLLWLHPARAAEDDLPNPIRLQVGCFRVTSRFVEEARPAEPPTTATEWIQIAREEQSYTLRHVAVSGKKAALASKEVWTKLSDGSWRLGVYNADDSPRYYCEGRFGKNRLTCKAPGAMKPARDDKRTDYDRIDRGLSLVMHPQRWVQQESNEKVKKDGTLISIEVGLVEYDRLHDKKCEPALKAFPQEKI